MKKIIFNILLVSLFNSCVYFDYALLKEDVPSNLPLQKEIEFTSVLYHDIEAIPGLKIEVKHLEKTWSERKKKGNTWESSIDIEYENGENDLQIFVMENTLYHEENNNIVLANKSITFWNSEDKYLFKNSPFKIQELTLKPNISRNFVSLKNSYNIDHPPKEFREYIELKIIIDGEIIIIKFDFLIKYFKHYSIIDVWMSV